MMPYRLMKGEVIDLSDPALFNQEDLAFLFNLQHRAFWEGEPYDKLRLDLAGGPSAYPIWRMRQTRVTREVHNSPLYRVAEDIIDRAGIRQGAVGSDVDDILYRSVSGLDPRSFTPFEKDMVLVHLGDLKSDEDARKFLDLAKFQGKDSAQEDSRKAKMAFDALGWAYRVTIGGTVCLAEYAGWDASQFNGWVPSIYD